MGFNNEGHGAVLERLRRRKHKLGIVGINIGANKDSADRVSDYVAGISAFSDVASYFTINISSPNTPGLRNLQSAEELRPLLQRLNEARKIQKRQVPMLLKIAPDLQDDELQAIADCCLNSSVDGVIISNTTISRPSLQSRHAQETGGLSGAPLFELSTRQLARFLCSHQRKNPARWAQAASQAPNRPGPRFALVPLFCSSIPHWSFKGLNWCRKFWMAFPRKSRKTSSQAWPKQWEFRPMNSLTKGLLASNARR